MWPRGTGRAPPHLGCVPKNRAPCNCWRGATCTAAPVCTCVWVCMRMCGRGDGERLRNVWVYRSDVSRMSSLRWNGMACRIWKIIKCDMFALYKWHGIHDLSSRSLRGHDSVQSLLPTPSHLLHHLLFISIIPINSLSPLRIKFNILLHHTYFVFLSIHLIYSHSTCPPYWLFWSCPSQLLDHHYVWRTLPAWPCTLLS